MADDREVDQPVRENTNPEGIPAFPNPSASVMFDAADAQHARQTGYSHEASSEDSGPRQYGPMKTCVACTCQMEEVDVIEAPCGHNFCRECINRVFELSVEDESNFPPKCCDPLTLEDTGSFLSSEIYEKFREKSEEFSATTRTYCFDPTCAAFISPKAIGDDKAKCPACQKMTCTRCKAEDHEGDCAENLADQSFMIAVAEAGFQRCQQCTRVIERAQGCNHIT